MPWIDKSKVKAGVARVAMDINLCKDDPQHQPCHEGKVKHFDIAVLHIPVGPGSAREEAYPDTPSLDYRIDPGGLCPGRARFHRRCAEHWFRPGN
jgi:hypothetical protein